MKAVHCTDFSSANSSLKPAGWDSIIMFTSRERCLDRIYQNWTLKTIQARERPQIEIVLHSAVQHSKHGQRLQLFGDDRFLWISPQDRSRKFQKGRVLDFNCCWCNNVAKANIDLHWDSSASKGCMEANAHALVLGILFNPGDLYRLCIEFNPVRFGFEFANFSDQSANVVKLVGRSPEEIDIHLGARERRTLSRLLHCTC